MTNLLPYIQKDLDELFEVEAADLAQSFTDNGFLPTLKQDKLKIGLAVALLAASIALVGITSYMETNKTDAS